MLYLITGQPGSGKTALALHRAFELKKQGRDIYAHGIKDLDYDRAGFKRFPDDDPTKWQQLPDGSVCLIDECYGAFPNRNAASKVPDHVEALARHRHRGFDFILIAQQGLQLDPFLRGLYESHEHVKRKLGKFTELRRWSAYQGNVNGHCADKSNWTRPKYVFDYYTSTVADTSKNHVPMWIRYIAVLVLFLVGMFYYLKHSSEAKIAAIKAEQERVQAAAGVSVAGAGGTPAAPGKQQKQPRYGSPEEYIAAHMPRLQSLPWTAPIYDDRPVLSDPRVFCMSSGIDGSEGCNCKTEQGTSYALPEAECKLNARHGAPYNPYRMDTSKMLGPQVAARKDPPQENAVAPAPVVTLVGPQVEGYGDLAIGPTPARSAP